MLGFCCLPPQHSDRHVFMCVLSVLPMPRKIVLRQAKREGSPASASCADEHGTDSGRATSSGASSSPNGAASAASADIGAFNSTIHDISVRFNQALFE